MEFKKLQQQELKRMIKIESELQKERKIKINQLLKGRSDKKIITYNIGNLQRKIKENSDLLTYYHHRYSGLRKTKFSNYVSKFELSTYGMDKKIKALKYKTYILYLDIDSYTIGETEFITENEFILVKNVDLNSKEKIDNNKILFVDVDKDVLLEKLNALNLEIDELPQSLRLKEIILLNKVKELEKNKKLSKHIKEHKRLNEIIKNIEKEHILDYRKRKDESNEIIDQLWKIKENKLKEIKNGL